MAENFTVDPKRDAEDNKVMAILAYLGILFLVPLLAAKESPFARFHTNQGIALFILGAAVGIVVSILSAIFSQISLTLVLLTSLLSLACSLGIFVLAIIGIVNAVKGEMKELPLIGKYKILK
ncbi:MAG: zinc ribbon domain-containing protein [Tannerella sp.]|jgi:uncharacterized membrane protein|nr:zinc ribbon domain-containing protein [Tannerella sp.]